MDLETFWNLVETSREHAGMDIERQAGFLISALAQRPEQEIISFEENLTQLLWLTHDAKLMAASAILDDMDDDDFQDFCLWLISRGKSVFERCRQDPEILVEVVQIGERIKAPEFAGVTREAYKRRTGVEEFETPVGKALFPELINAELRWQTSEGYADTERLRALFPKLWEKFGARFDLENE